LRTRSLAVTRRSTAIVIGFMSRLAGLSESD
jgi:hypothetical protein